MSQSNVIFAAIFIAYLIFITMRGEIPIYWGLLVRSPPPGGGNNPIATGQGANSTGGIYGQSGGATGLAEQAVALAPYAAAL